MEIWENIGSNYQGKLSNNSDIEDSTLGYGELIRINHDGCEV